MRRIWPALLVLACGMAAAAGEDENLDRQDVLRLDLILVRGAFSLKHFHISSDTLTPTPELPPAPGLVYYTVADHSGRPLYEGVIPDPARVIREQRDSTGRLHADTITVDSVAVTMRLPYEREVHLVHFVRIVIVNDTGLVPFLRTEEMGSVYVEVHGE